MANFSDLPNELLTQIFAYFANHIHLNEFFALRLVARQFRIIINDTDSLWAGCLGTDELEVIKERNILYYHYLKERYFELQTTINKPNQSLFEQSRLLKEKGLEKLSNAALIVCFPEFRKFFLIGNSFIKDSSLGMSSNFFDSVEIAVKHELIAHFILKDNEFRKAWLKEAQGSVTITRLAQRYKSIALTLIREDVTWLIPILEETEGTVHIQNLISTHEEAFIKFFQNEKLKIAFLESFARLQKQRLLFQEQGFPITNPSVQETICKIASNFNIIEQTEKSQLYQKPPEALIAHIIHKLMERRQLTIEKQPNEGNIARPRP